MDTALSVGTVRDWRRIVVIACVAGLMGVAHAEGDERADLVAKGRRLFERQGCYGCHLVGKFGTPIGPDLSRVGTKYPEAYLKRWLADPEALRPHARMPMLELDPAEVEALAAWLSTLR